MVLEYLALPIAAVLLGALAVGLQLIDSRRFDQRWPRHPHSGE